MTDEADRADPHIEAAINIGVNNARARANVDTTNPGGTCWNCESPVSTDRRWCDFHCMTEWELSGGR